LPQELLLCSKLRKQKAKKAQRMTMETWRSNPPNQSLQPTAYGGA
jgi:hypothetical protein